VDDRDVEQKSEMGTQARLTYEDTRRLVVADIRNLTAKLDSGCERPANVGNSPALCGAESRSDQCSVSIRCQHALRGIGRKAYATRSGSSGTEARERGFLDLGRVGIPGLATRHDCLISIMPGHGSGSEVMQRIPVPMVGGVVTAPLPSMFIIPAAWPLLQRRRLARAGRLANDTSQP
jgi:hypothetical protein